MPASYSVLVILSTEISGDPDKRSMRTLYEVTPETASQRRVILLPPSKQLLRRPVGLLGFCGVEGVLGAALAGIEGSAEAGVDGSAEAGVDGSTAAAITFIAALTTDLRLLVCDSVVVIIVASVKVRVEVPATVGLILMVARVPEPVFAPSAVKSAVL